jgi:hypothetical protein
VPEHVAIRLEGCIGGDVALNLLFLEKKLGDARESRFLNLAPAVPAGLVDAPRESIKRKGLVVRALEILISP